MKTTGNKILIQKINNEAQEKSSSGIILDTPKQRDVIKANVIEIGKDVKEVQKGDIVAVETQTIKDFVIDGKTYSIVPEASVLAYESTPETLQAINESKDC